MARTPVQLQQLESAVFKQLGSFVDLPKIDAPFTTVVKRGQMTDLSQDLMPRMGIERIVLQSVQEVQDETGPSGERVFKTPNDLHNQIRFVGQWINLNDLSGARPYGQVTGDYIEVSFYGTGLNLLHFIDGGARTYNVFVDGQAAAGFTITGSSLLNGRNYAPNQVVPVVRGLTLGHHTVKVVANAVPQFVIYGVEILNEASTIKTSPASAYFGGKKLSLSTLDSQAFNSSFESGTLGTKGGRVVVYIDPDGTIKKVLTPTDSSQLNLTSTNHTNEELIRAYYYREFGAGRTDDFSLFGTGSFVNLAYTLDDGTTTLLGNQVRMHTNGSDKSVNAANVGSFLTFTFVGTGLDIGLAHDGTNSTVIVDNVNIGNLAVTGTVPNNLIKTKIVSGLPYGTHTVRFTSAGANISIGTFYVYGPKKPTIPTDVVELADYYLMADHTSLAAEGTLTTSSGTLRKHPTREAVFTGAGWGITGVDTGSPLAGFAISTTGGANAGNYVEYTFVGTGVDFRVNSEGSASYTVMIDGVTNFTVSNGAFWTGGLTLSNSGGAFVTTNLATTGVYSGNTGVGRLTFEGMNFTKHTIRITMTSSTGGGLYPESFDIITPIHSPKVNGPAVFQNTTTVGSNSIGDSRIFSESQDLDIPNWAQALAIQSGSTSSSAFVPMPDMSCVVKTSGNPLDIFFSGTFNMTAASPIIASIAIYVNGILFHASRDFSNQTSFGRVTAAIGCVAPVPAGTHIVQVYWGSDGTNTLGAVSTLRALRVKEL